MLTAIPIILKKGHATQMILQHHRLFLSFLTQSYKKILYICTNIFY